jgi:hypothetical protein
MRKHNDGHETTRSPELLPCRRWSPNLLRLVSVAVFTAGAALALAVPASAASSTVGSVMINQGTLGGPATQMLEIGQANAPQTLMTVDNGSSAQGAPVIFYQATDASNGLPEPDQLWQFVPDNGIDDVFQGSWGELANVNSGLCLNVSGASTAAGQQLIQWPCTNSDNEEWQTVATSSKTFGFASELGGVYLGQNSASCAAGDDSPVVTSATDGGNCDNWYIQRIGGQPITLENNANPGAVVDSENPDDNWLTQAGIEAADGSATQSWYIQAVGTTDLEGRPGTAKTESKTPARSPRPCTESFR